LRSWSDVPTDVVRIRLQSFSVVNIAPLIVVVAVVSNLMYEIFQHVDSTAFWSNIFALRTLTLTVTNKNYWLSHLSFVSLIALWSDDALWQGHTACLLNDLMADIGFHHRR
jgi:peptidoglycan/LPS O-acetylase OafA/YrhL